MKHVMILSLFFASTSYGAIVLNCECTDGPGTVQDITITGNSLRVTSSDSLNGMEFSATLDPSYKKGTSQRVRFVGEQKGNRRAVILPADLLTTAHKGFAQIQGNEDGYWSANYNCTKR